MKEMSVSFVFQVVESKVLSNLISIKHSFLKLQRLIFYRLSFPYSKIMLQPKTTAEIHRRGAETERKRERNRESELVLIIVIIENHAID